MGIALGRPQVFMEIITANTFIEGKGSMKSMKRRPE
jgi:hypothetical protein